MKSSLYFLFLFSILMSMISSCNPSEEFDTQGHRGCRGLLPENTIPAFQLALEIGVKTLELDLAITKDLKVLVSHEPFFNHEISTHPDGIEITEENEQGFNIYSMTAIENKEIDVGMKRHPRFPNQKKINVSKPLLSELIEAATFTYKALGRAAPYYNVEIKSKPAWDEIFYPSYEKFVDLTVDVLKKYKISDKSTIQSFDIRALEYVHSAYPELKTVYLVETEKDCHKALEMLTFVPDVYSPYFEFVDEKMVSTCRNKQIKLIPWTVNKEKDIINLLSLGVDGIISDFPDLLVKTYEAYSINANN